MCVFLTINTFSQPIEIIEIGGRPPETYRTPEYIPDEANGDVCLQNVPIYNWSYGCSPTAAAMLIGYYDWKGWDKMYEGPAAINGFVPPSNIEWWGSGHCPLSASEQGIDERTVRGHVDDYWVDEGQINNDPYIIGGWDPHPDDCLADFMGTSQDYWSLADGWTTFFWDPSGNKLHDYTGHENQSPSKRCGCHGIKLFIDYIGYTVLQNYTQYIKSDDIPNGFTFDDYKNEINDNRPVLLHLTDHTMLGIGYNNNGNKVIVLDTWDINTHEMIWAGAYYNGNTPLYHYGVTVIEIADPPPHAADDFVEFINNPPTVLDLETWYQYEAFFTSVGGGSNPIWWEWSIVLYHESGDYQLFFKHEDIVSNNNWCWVTTPAELPQHNWIRNTNGNIDGYAKVKVRDSDGFGHFDQLDIEFLFGPPTPQIVGASAQNNSLFLSYVTMGATEYEIYYDTDPGPPYDGTGAVQGNSPIDANNLTTFEISGLQNCTPYYFAVKAINDQGQSVFSPEKEIMIIESANQNIQYVFDDYYLNYSTTLDDNYFFTGNLIIGSGITVTLGGNNTFGEDSKIIIESGGKLTLDGATCTAPCDQTWQGIEVWGDPGEHQYTIEGECAQGYLVLKNGAKIENAVIGVLLAATYPDGTIDITKTGGIVQVQQTNNTGNPDDPAASFINNQTAINFQPYHNSLPIGDIGRERSNLSYFNNALFEVNGDYLMGNTWWDAHIYMFDVYGISIKGSTFVNNFTPEPSGHGINAYHAGFSVYNMCSEGITPCPEESILKSSFTNFTKGINLLSADTYTINVNNAEFYNNSNSIILSDVDNASLIFNKFYIGENDDNDEQQCGETTASYGIDISESIGFIIEENYFTKAQGKPAGNYIGIRLTTCPSFNDVIYLNEFDGLSVGIQAEGINRSGGDESGVTYLCNHNTANNYDFYVADVSMVGGFMGGSENPSGNTLSPNAQKQFQNDYTETVVYYYKQEEPDQVLSKYSRFVVPVPVGDPYENDCPSHYGGQPPIDGSFVLNDSDKLQMETEFLQSHTDYQNVEALYNSLLDGGNTEALQVKVETAWPTDMWELRAELLGKSPHLSKEVLMTVADKTEVLPESVIFEILSANPDELRKEELMAYLENKEQPLPQYMVDILRQLASGTTYKTVLQSEMAAYHAQKIAAAQAIIRSIVNEEEPDMDELRDWYDNIGGMEADKQILETYVQEGDYTAAQSLIDMLPALYDLSDEKLQAYNDYKQLKQLEIDLAQQGRTIFDLSASELASVVNLAEYGSGSAKTSARGMLEFAYAYDYCNCPNLPENIQLKSATIDMGDLAKAKGLVVSAEPNPAYTWVAFDYTLPLLETEGTIEINDNLGRTIETFILAQQQGQYVLDTRSYKAGVYYYTLKCGTLQQTGKLIVN